MSLGSDPIELCGLSRDRFQLVAKPTNNSQASCLLSFSVACFRLLTEPLKFADGQAGFSPSSPARKILGHHQFRRCYISSVTPELDSCLAQGFIIGHMLLYLLNSQQVPGYQKGKTSVGLS